MAEKVLIIDFGGHYSQLIARRVRELSVYCDIYPSTFSLEKIKEYNPLGIILTGEQVNINEDVDNFKESVKQYGCPVMEISDEIVKDVCSEENNKIKDFLYNDCKCKGEWTMSQFTKNIIEEIKEKVGNGKVLLALSGGVDSSVCAVLLSKAIGNQLTCVFVDHGLLRKNEADEVEAVFGKKGVYDLNFIRVDAQQRFYGKLKGVTDPEKKRKIIGEEFIRVFEEEAKKIGKVDFLAQGTIYPDIIESGVGKHGMVKSHHNVGGLPSVVDFKEIIEPLRALFKDEVRKVGLELGLPEHLVFRQPFPGPGLGVRIIGEITEEKVRIVQDADFIYREEIAKAGLNKTISQYFAAITNMQSVGVRGDKRTYEYAIALRAVLTSDFMTAKWAKIPYDVLDVVSSRIVKEVVGVNRVLYDCTSKPPATIEFE